MSTVSRQECVPHLKQRHRVWRGLERLRDDHRYDGGKSIGQDAVRKPKLSRQKVCLSLRHDRSETQIDSTST